MFSFHKPKVYRSTQGCCICKAKSSSSRFTDSKKYEFDFIECFQLEIPRKGEICNACVLLVKRYKRLPPGSDRHWGHVVDARVGPGLKSMTKFKKRKEEQQQQQLQLAQAGNATATDGTTTATTISSVKHSISVPERFCKIFKKNKKKKNDLENLRDNSPGSTYSSPCSPMSHASDDDKLNLASDFDKSLIGDLLKASQMTNGRISKKYKRKNYLPIKNRSQPSAAASAISYLDETMWRKIKTCCGHVFQNECFGALIIDYDLYQPCLEHKKQKFDEKIKTEFIVNKTLIGKASDNVNVPTTAVKKHHLYSKRQNHIDSQIRQEQKSDLILMTSPTINFIDSSSVAITNTTNTINSNSNKYHQKLLQQQNSTNNYLHKIKSGSDSSSISSSSSSSGKIIKNSVLDKINPVKIKSTDFNVVKNLVKMCTDKSNKIKIVGGEIKNDVETLGNKFSDNSSDSGYEEPHDQILLSQQKLKIAANVRPLVLANGIKLHVQPQNLVLAANLAGVPSTTMVTLQQKQPINKNEIIYVQQQSQINSNLPQNQKFVVNSTTTAQSQQQSQQTTNQNIILVKPKFLQQTAN